MMFLLDGVFNFNMINYIKHGLVKKRNNIRITLGCARPFLVI